MTKPIIISNRSIKRVRFTLFTKILFKHLQESDDKNLFYEARAIVRQTLHLHRSNEKIFPPLFQVVEEQLRDLVGETRWRHTHKLMRFYLAKKTRFTTPPPRPTCITIGSKAAWACTYICALALWLPYCYRFYASLIHVDVLLPHGYITPCTLNY